MENRPGAIPFISLRMKKDSTASRKQNTAFSVLKNAQYTWLLCSNLAFFFAMQAQMVLRAWLAFKLTNSEFALGLVMFAIAVPMFFLSPVGGVMADRIDRRKLIILGQLTVFLLDLLILALLLTDRLEFWHLILNAAIIGSAFPFIMPARNAIVVNVVRKSNLEKAMAINMGGVNMTRVLGPAIAGFLIDFIGVSYAYCMGVLLYGVGLLFMIRVSSSKPASDIEHLSPLKSVIEGASYVKEHHLIFILLLFGLIPMFLAMPFQSLLVVFAEKVWQVGPRGFGFLSASIGIGGITGSLLVTSFKSDYSRLKRMMFSVIFFGFFLFCFSVSPWFFLGLPLVFVANVFASIFQTLNNTAIQMLIPDRVRGRITSFLMMSFSLPLLGTLPIAALAESLGAPFAVGLSSVLAILISLLFFMISPELRKMNQRLKAGKTID